MSNISLSTPEIKRSAAPTVNRGTTNILGELFLVFFKIGAFTLGGGFAMIPLIKKELVEDKGWLTRDEFLDKIAIAQSVPGAIAVNTAAITGHKIKGWPGSFIATLGVIIPSLSIILFIAMFLTNFASLTIVQSIFRAVRPVVVALIANSAYKCWKTLDKSKFNFIIEILAFIALVFFNFDPMMVIIIAISYGVLRKVDFLGKLN